MINDPAVLLDIVRQWSALRSLCRSSHRSGMVGRVFVNETPPEELYNLPFVLAYAVLDQVLDELVDQGAFPRPSGKPTLAAKATASRTHLPWVNYGSVDAGRIARNEVAHEAKLRGKTECLGFVDDIERELKAWGIL
jgi:hypothetical protein